MGPALDLDSAALASRLGVEAVCEALVLHPGFDTVAAEIEALGPAALSFEGALGLLRAHVLRARQAALPRRELADLGWLLAELSSSRLRLALLLRARALMRVELAALLAHDRSGSPVECWGLVSASSSPVSPAPSPASALLEAPLGLDRALALLGSSSPERRLRLRVWRAPARLVLDLDDAPAPVSATLVGLGSVRAAAVRSAQLLVADPLAQMELTARIGSLACPELAELARFALSRSELAESSPAERLVLLERSLDQIEALALAGSPELLSATVVLSRSFSGSLAQLLDVVPAALA